MTINEYQKKLVTALPECLYRSNEFLISLMSLSGSNLPKEVVLNNLTNAMFSVVASERNVEIYLSHMVMPRMRSRKVKRRKTK